MWFSLFAVVLILAITFFQGLQGLFSAVITCIAAVLSAALAFGLYEDLYFAFLIEPQPDYGKAAMLLGVFIVAMLILRTLFDSLIKGNMQFPVYVDRAGGGLFGLVTGLIIVGMVAVGFQMLPFNSTLMGFTRYRLVSSENKTVDIPQEGNAFAFKDMRLVPNSLWLNPDRFVVALVSNLSAGALHGGTSFSDVYPDFVSGLHWARCHPVGKIQATVPKDVFRVIGYWDLKPSELFSREEGPEVKNKPGVKTIRLVAAPPPEAGMKHWAIRLQFDDKAAESDRVFRCMPQQIRLVARDRKNGPVKEYFAIGINEEGEAAGGKLIKLFPGEGIVRQPPEGPRQFDFVYQIPDGPDFKPEFVEFKGNARAEFAPSMDANKKRLPPLGPKPKEPKGPPRPRNETQAPPTPPDAQAGQDRISGVGPARAISFDPHLPFTLTDYSAVDIEMKGNSLEGGRIHAILDDNWQPKKGTNAPISGFVVPEGKRLLQLSVEKLQPESWLGNIYSGVINTIADFYIVAEGGKNYKPVGAYGLAEVSRRKHFELVFLASTARDVGTNLPPMEHLRPRDFKGDYAFYFLFHLPPGTKPVRLHTGRQDVDLTPLNLVVP